jgi:hypothetical protein
MAKHLHLEWIYEEPCETAAGFSDHAGLIPPPPEELSTLYKLARFGNMTGIVQYAGHIEELGEKYAPFARRLKSLAEEFEDEQILETVRRFVLAAENQQTCANPEDTDIRNLMTEMKAAAEDGDSEKLYRIIAGIPLHHKGLAEKLTRLTDDFEFDTILEVIQDVLQEDKAEDAKNRSA